MKLQRTWLFFAFVIGGLGCGGGTPQAKTENGDPDPTKPTVGSLSLSNLSATTPEDTPLVINLSAAAAAGIEFVVVTAPTHGALGSVSGNTVSYTPTANYAGVDAFTFAAVRGSERVEAIASLTITPVDDFATPANDSLSVLQWESTAVLTGGAASVLENDTDIDGGPAPSATLVSPPAHGLLTLNLDGTFSYLHDGSAESSDTFTYSIGPGAQATVAITVLPAAVPALANLNFNGEVLAAVHLGDAWFVGGRFTSADLLPARRLLAVTLSGEPTVGCNVQEGFDDTVNSIVHIGNSLYAGGHFHHYRGQPASYLAKIDMTTCELDVGFSPPANNGFDDFVRKVATDGTALYIIGAFNAYRAAPAHYIAKIDASTGALNEAFMNPSGILSNGFNSDALDLCVRASDVFVGGAFTDYRGVANSARGIARLNAMTGDLIIAFGMPGINNGFAFSGSPAGVSAVALNADGSALYAAGSFNEYRNGASVTPATRIARISLEDGSASTTFSPAGPNGFDNNVSVLEFADGALFVGGAFDTYRGTQSAHRIAKLHATTGALDTTFSPQDPPPYRNGFEGSITAIVGIGGAILVGGQPLGGYRSDVDLTTGLAKLDTATGALDPAFLLPAGHDHAGFPEASQTMHSARVVGSTLWIAGSFKHIGGRSANRIARIKDSDGSLDRTFSPPASNGFDSEVLALAASSDALYVGGSFNDYRGQPSSASAVAKLNPTTGAIDTMFGPVGPTANGFNGRVQALLYDAGQLYVGGNFSEYRGVLDSAWSIAKLNAVSGQIDTTFSPPGGGTNGFDDDVNTLAKRGNDLFVGGDFSMYRGGTDNSRYIAKLDATTGVLASDFGPPGDNGFDSTVNAIVLMGDSLYVGGYFSAYRSTAGVGNIVKLSAADGVLDGAFSATGPTGPTAGFDGVVRTLAASGEALYVGGNFFGYRGVPGSANFIAKLNPATGALYTTFTPAGATVGSGGVNVLAPYHDLVFAGGSFANCDSANCYQNATRFDRVTRAFK